MQNREALVKIGISSQMMKDLAIKSQKGEVEGNTLKLCMAAFDSLDDSYGAHELKYALEEVGNAPFVSVEGKLRIGKLYMPYLLNACELAANILQTRYSL